MTESLAPMPAEYAPHERTIMCWPVRDDVWAIDRRQAELDHAFIAQTIARHEPVSMVAHPRTADTARDLCGPSVEIVEIPIDDSWARDSGPIYRAPGRPVDYRFNSWGEKFVPYADDAELARRWSAQRGERPTSIDVVLEGGSIHTDGLGTVLTTEQCLLNPNRNPGLSRRAIEQAIGAGLGLTTVVWMPFGLADDDDTDGHVDNVATFAAPGVVVMQGCSDRREPDFDRMAVNQRCVRDALDARGEPLTVVDIPVLPFVEFHGERLVVPYLNFYVFNGGVVVPVTGHDADDEMLGLIAAQFPGRVVHPVPGVMLAHGGGGPHCITQQIPA